MAQFSIAELAQLVGGRVHGDERHVVTGLAEPHLAGPSDLAVAMSAKFLGGLAQGRARAAIISEASDAQGLGLTAVITIARPRLAMAELTGAFANGAARSVEQGHRHPSAVIDGSAQIADSASIGALAVIEAGATIGDGCKIGPGCFIASGVHIGSNAHLAANVTINANCTIGDGFVAHSGVVIGADGFSFVTPEPSGVDEVKGSLADPKQSGSQAWVKISSLGGVTIGDDVEIGANSSVDAGTIRPTSIGHGTKIDALVQVGHNATVGPNCLLCAHVAVGGSASIGEGSVLGGQVGVADNITLGAGVVAGGATKILTSVPKGRAILGYPAVKMEQHVEMYKSLRRLPRLISRVAGLEKAVSKDTTSD